MTNEDYKKLNYYLNITFDMLEYEDDFLINNCDMIDFTCDEILYNLSDITINKKVVKNKLTYKEVFLLAREIINQINPKYLKEFDDLIVTGRLDFSYEMEYRDSEFIYFYESKTGIININREFNYRDVVLLIHEFFHYINSKTKLKNDNLYLLTEFISIYFENYAVNYLINDNIKFDQINAYFRINNLSKHIEQYQKYSSVITAFTNFGNIGSSTIYLMNNYFYDITKEKFDENCLYLLREFEKIENDYRMEIKYQKEFNDVLFAYKLSNVFKYNYRYILGIILAFYAIDNCDIMNIISLNDKINSMEYVNMDVYEILNKIGINLNDESFILKTSDSIKKFVKNIQR